ncbi:VanZ family protein [Ectobacillus antri]|jgi:glycopeptide antibiotics resistance protein|uniref:VanZ family protein n=1 Tax=Ectobacillus antri TaxID=2486280 RepID=A0ABT6H261_9BACI|nr:VanZ family protein [Ectobacillus antri]MDG4656446.1 VanZ family protein [Ectobacillus antri]MDG5753496.1 VanZ family protein [Ectobacillus antri]
MKFSFRRVIHHMVVFFICVLTSFIIMERYVDDAISKMIPYASIAVFLLIRFIGASLLYFVYVCMYSIMRYRRIRLFRWFKVYFSLLYLLLLGFMLFAREPEAGNVKDNYIPFHTIDLYLNNNVASIYIATNLLGNIILFIPVGVFLCYVVRNRYAASCLSLLTTIGIEMAQKHYTIGSFDVDDILLNFIGAWAGVLFCNLSLKKGED